MSLLYFQRALAGLRFGVGGPYHFQLCGWGIRLQAGPIATRAGLNSRSCNLPSCPAVLAHHGATPSAQSSESVRASLQAPMRGPRAGQLLSAHPAERPPAFFARLLLWWSSLWAKATELLLCVVGGSLFFTSGGALARFDRAVSGPQDFAFKRGEAGMHGGGKPVLELEDGDGAGRTEVPLSGLPSARGPAGAILSAFANPALCGAGVRGASFRSWFALWHLASLPARSSKRHRPLVLGFTGGKAWA